MNKKPESLEKGNRIVDIYYSRSEYLDSWGIGLVQEVKKTIVIVSFPNAVKEKDRIQTYDYTHIRNFTKKVDLRNTKDKQIYG